MMKFITLALVHKQTARFLPDPQLHPVVRARHSSRSGATISLIGRPNQDTKHQARIVSKWPAGGIFPSEAPPIAWRKEQTRSGDAG